MRILTRHSAINLVSVFDCLPFDTTNHPSRNLNPTKFFTWSKLITIGSFLLSSSHPNTCLASFQQTDDERVYYREVLEYISIAKTGSTCDGNQVFPRTLEFEIDDDFETKHQTVLKVACKSPTSKESLSTKTFTFNHKRTGVGTTLLPRFEFNEFGLTRSVSHRHIYYRPALRFQDGNDVREILSAKKYPKTEIDPYGQKACAFAIYDGINIVKNPDWGTYEFKECDLVEQTNSYFYGNGVNFVRARALIANCRQGNKNFAIAYVIPTEHQLFIQPDCFLANSAGRRVNHELSFHPNIVQGLFKRTADGKWQKLDRDLKLIRDEVYVVKSQNGPWVKQFMISPTEDTNEAILSMLEKLPYLQDIAGIDLSDRVFTNDEQMRVAQLLARMNHLSSLNFAKTDSTVNYNSLVPALLSLPRLSNLNVSNSGISEEHLRGMHQGCIDYTLASTGGLPFPFLQGAGGLGDPEERHRWTVGENAVIQIPLQPHLRGLKCISFIDTSGFVTKDLTQTVTVSCNDTPSGQYLYTVDRNYHTIHVPVQDGKDIARVTFNMPNAVSPTAVHYNTDPRVLAINFGAVRLWFDKIIYDVAINDGCPSGMFKCGFSNPERSHRWTDGTRAILEFPVVQNHQRIQSVTFKNTFGCVTANHNQFLHVSVGGAHIGDNGREVAHYQYSENSHGKMKQCHTVLVPIPEDTGDIARILFDLPNAISPASLLPELSFDPRLLGVHFNLMKLSFSKLVYNLAISNGFPTTIPGFSYSGLSYIEGEGTHRWTDGAEAIVEVPIVHNNRRLSSVLFVDTIGHFSPNQTQVVEIFLNDKKVPPQYRYNMQKNNQTIKIPIPAYSEKAKIKFKIRDPKSPAELQTGTDQRKLGIALGQVVLKYPLQIIQ